MLFFRELQKQAEQTSKDKRVSDYFRLYFSHESQEYLKLHKHVY